MTYNLSEAIFVNDFYYIDREDGSIIALNLIDEDIQSGSAGAVINVINIAVVDTEGNQKICSNVIGMTNEYFSLNSAYKEHLGTVLNKDNIQYCTLEVFDE